jgi:hypothetical protein
MSGRIVLHLDQGLGWTKPLVVACCGACGVELARHPNHHRAIRAARRRRCPACGTRTARRLPGTTSPATDLAVAKRGREVAGRRRWPPARQPAPLPRHGKEVNPPHAYLRQLVDRQPGRPAAARVAQDRQPLGQ